MSMNDTAESLVTETVPSVAPALHVLTACDVASGAVMTPGDATAIEVTAARRDLNCKGNGTEWYRMVWRDGSWQYFSDQRMPARGFRASDRKVTLTGSVYEGEIFCAHARGGPVDAVRLVVSDPTGKVKHLPLQWSKCRDGLRVILPTGTHVTLPDPRGK